ncbi:hypothetical protein BH20PSE1_BH20PSE1_01270 [soil metagenome]
MPNACISTVVLANGQSILCRRRPWPNGRSFACHTHHPHVNATAVRQVCWAMLKELQLVAERRAKARGNGWSG